MKVKWMFQVNMYIGEINKGAKEGSKKRMEDLPLSSALITIGIWLLDGDWHANSGGRWGVVVPVDPTLENFSEAAFADHPIWVEVIGRRRQLRQSELPQQRWPR